MDKKEYDRLRYIANKEKRKKQVSEYYQANKDKVKEYQKNYDMLNRDKINERQKQYYKKDPEKFAKRNAEWAKNNPEKVKAYQESSLYEKKSKIARWKHQGIITNDYNNVYEVYINTTNCDYCNKEFKNSLDRHLDHDHNINDSNNIRGILCRVCNTSDVLKGYPPIF